MENNKGNILIGALTIGALILATFGYSFQSSQHVKNLEKEYQKQVNTIVEDFKLEVDMVKAANTANFEYFQSQQSVPTLGAFRPSGYTGKLLTRLIEGGSETTFNTTPGTAPDGTSLTTLKIGDFIVITINPGAANEEKISASAVSVSGTTATWTIVNRGLSFTENASVAANINQHAIGETVIISNDDHFLSEQYPTKDGNETITGTWTFDVFPITPDNSTSTESAAGIVEIATAVEAASSTENGTAGRLVLPASLATSTYNSSGSLQVVMTDNSNKIDTDFLSLSTYTGSLGASSITITSTSTIGIASTSAFTSSFTWVKPSTLKYVCVEVVGAGGSGGGSIDLGATGTGGAGGGGGGYSKECFFPQELTSTVAVDVGTTAGSTSSFGSYLQATGGATGTGNTGGLGGAGSGGDINIVGGDGSSTGTASAAAAAGGTGGSSALGGGGRGGYNTAEGSGGHAYGGGGGGGGINGSQDSTAGGSGAAGAVIITEIYY
jgi:hypothetical protein